MSSDILGIHSIYPIQEVIWGSWRGWFLKRSGVHVAEPGIAAVPMHLPRFQMAFSETVPASEKSISNHLPVK